MDERGRTRRGGRFALVCCSYGAGEEAPDEKWNTARPRCDPAGLSPRIAPSASAKRATEGAVCVGSALTAAVLLQLGADV